jgi:AAA domain-containing protein
VNSTGRQDTAQGGTARNGLKEALRITAQSDASDTSFLEFVAEIRNDIGDEALFDPGALLRFAQIKRDNPSWYKGEVLAFLKRWLPDRWRDWDRDVDNAAVGLDQVELLPRPLSQFPKEEVAWVWWPYIARRKLTFTEGASEAGKTFLILALAAAITNGYSLPDQDGRVGEPNPAMANNMLYITAEDGIGDTIRGRAEDLGVDTDRLHVLGPEDFMRAGKIPTLETLEPWLKMLAHSHPLLFVLDPLQAFLGPKVDINRVNEVRPLMTNLLALAQAFDCGIMPLRHWTKGVGGRAKDRWQGNADFTAAARSVLSVGEAPEGHGLRIMAHAKSNLAPRGTSLAFQIVDGGFEWCGTSDITADELANAQPTMHKQQNRDVMEWLRDELQDGPQRQTTIEAMAKASGISTYRLRQAKEQLGVLANRDGVAWYWRLPNWTPFRKEEA